jgi:hypothetical protein
MKAFAFAFLPAATTNPWRAMRVLKQRGRSKAKCNQRKSMRQHYSHLLISPMEVMKWKWCNGRETKQMVLHLLL